MADGLHGQHMDAAANLAEGGQNLVKDHATIPDQQMGGDNAQDIQERKSNATLNLVQVP